MKLKTSNVEFDVFDLKTPNKKLTGELDLSPKKKLMSGNDST